MMMLVPQLVTRVTKLPYGVDPSYLGYQTHVVTTQVRPRVSGNNAVTLTSLQCLTIPRTGAGPRLAGVGQHPALDPHPRHPRRLPLPLPPYLHPLQTRLLPEEAA